MTAAPPLIIHVLHHLVIGGMENGLVNLINHLPPSLWRHRVLCIEDYSEFRERIQRADVEVVALRRSQIGTWALRRRIFEECRRYRPAIVHARGLSGLDALPSAWLANVPAVLHSEHGWNVDDLEGAKARPALLRRLHSVFVDRHVVVSRHLGRYLADRVGIDRARIEHICNGVDTTRFVPRGEAGRAPAPEGFWNAASFVVGTVGRLQSVKDQAALLAAAARLLELRRELDARLRIVLVGAGPMEQELRARAAALRLDGRTWFAGAVQDVPSVLASFDVFVLSSLMEGISNTLLEAMACGLPIAASAVGGNVELLRDGDTGLLFPAGDVDALAHHLARMATEADLGLMLGARARAAAVKEFSLEAMTRRYGDLYGRMIVTRSWPSRREATGHRP
jgi:sugar transferase (PEP-CTERM/EpsH1 system associated)